MIGKYTRGAGLVKGGELERAAAAPLQASGWFVLRRPTDETFQAFELDVLAYRFEDGNEQSLVLEAKGGRSGFGDLWKLLGLKTHLKVDSGVLLADPSDPLHDRKVALGRGHQINVIDQDPADLAENLAEAGAIPTEPDLDVLAAWQRCYRVEDALIATINDKQLWQQYETIRLAKRQLQHLITKAWLEPDPWRQAFRLYRRYSEEPKIARRMAIEINGGGWGELFKHAMYDGASEEMQACFYLEHRKRIAVAFAATRCATLDDETSPWAARAPFSFREMVEQIAEEEAWYLPAVLQAYFLGFGGLICLDAEKSEFQHLAAQAGCTPAEARFALRLFEELFPTDGGWFYDDYELSRLKLMPVPLRGAGLRMREAVYGGDWLNDLATDLQRKVAGRTELGRAAEWEKRIMLA